MDSVTSLLTLQEWKNELRVSISNTTRIRLLFKFLPFLRRIMSDLFPNKIKIQGLMIGKGQTISHSDG